MNGRFGAIEERVERTLERRARDVAAPIFLPPNIRSRVRRRKARNAVAAGALVVAVLAASLAGFQVISRSLLDRETGRVPIDATQGHPALVASGLTETLVWHLEAWPMPDGRISTSLWWGAGGERFRIAERVLETDAPLDVRSYLPIELVRGEPASGIAWGTFGASATSVRVESGGCPASAIGEADATWIRVGPELVGVWATTVCGGGGTVAVLDEDGTPTATQALSLLTGVRSVIAGSTVGGQVWGFRRTERMMVRTPGGEREPAVVFSLSAGPSGGTTRMFAFPSAPPSDIPGLGSQPGVEQGRTFYFSVAPANTNAVVVAMGDGQYTATLASNVGDGFMLFFGEVPDGLQGATIVAYDASCNEIDRLELAAPEDASPAPPCPGA